MRFTIIIILALVSAIAAFAQEPSNIVIGRVFSPDGTPVRNREGTLHLHLDIDSSLSLSLTVRTDEEGRLQCEQQDALKRLKQEKGKRALAWVYLIFPEVGVTMTRRFFWTVGEPLPDLHLKPLARLKVEFVCPVLNVPLENKDVWVRRADDDHSMMIIGRNGGWLPADEWLTIAGIVDGTVNGIISVKLRAGEERRLVVPQMPFSKILVGLDVQVPNGAKLELNEKPLPLLHVGRNVLAIRWDYHCWEGWVEVDRTEPFSFVFVPPMHLLRIPTEQISMKPLLDTNPSLKYLTPNPITEVECEVVDKEGKKLHIGWYAFRLNRQAWKRWGDTIGALSFHSKVLYGKSDALLPQPMYEILLGWLWRGDTNTYFLHQKSPKFWVTRWTPMLMRMSVSAEDEGYLLAFPVRGGEGTKRQHFKIEFTPPKREPPKVLRLKTGRLEGTAQTLDGKPVAERTIIARFVENALVDYLTEDGEVAFFAETDKQGRFVFPELPEGKYDLFVEDIDWVGCTEVVVKAGKTTKVNLVGFFAEEQKAPRRRIVLRFRFPDGTPVAGYQVNAISTFAVSGRTDEQGRISLDVEGNWLDIRLLEVNSEEISLYIPPDQSEFTVTVPISLLGRVEGQVLLPDGSTSDKVLVTVWKLKKGRWNYASPRVVHRLRVLPDGRFFCSLPEGTYIFKAEPMLPDLYLNSTHCAPSLSPPVVVKGGEVTKVTWQLRPTTSRYLEFPFGQRFPPIGTLHIKTEHYDGQTYEAKFDLPMPVALVEPVAKLSDDEDMLWDGGIRLSPGFYRLTSWDWRGEEFKPVVRISESTDRLPLTPPSAFPTLTVTGRVLLPNNTPASNAIVALYDPDQKMKRWATVCDENGQFSLSVQLPSVEILEQQHLDTLLPNSKNELWLIAWKIGYGHSLIRRLPRPRYNERRTVDVGSLTLSQSERIEGQVVDESGKPLPFAGVVMLPIDTNLFVPKPDREAIMRELTAFEDFNVGSIPHAQADINGRFCVEGLRRGQYLLTAGIRFRENGEWKVLVAYQIVNVPSDKITVRLERLKGSLTAAPSDLTNALPFAEVEIRTPCWYSLWFHSSLRADEFGRFKAEGIPMFDNVPMLVRMMHRDGIIASFNPPKDWRYVVQLRP